MKISKIIRRLLDKKCSSIFLKSKKLLIPSFISFLCTSCGNYENARNLKLDGLRELVCGDRAYSTHTNTCEDRSIWVEADTGLVAYITIYGITNIDEAKEISLFIQGIKKKNKQNIPIVLEIYRSKRSEGRAPSEKMIFKEKI